MNELLAGREDSVDEFRSRSQLYIVVGRVSERRETELMKQDKLSSDRDFQKAAAYE